MSLGFAKVVYEQSIYWQYQHYDGEESWRLLLDSFGLIGGDSEIIIDLMTALSKIVSNPEPQIYELTSYYEDGAHSILIATFPAHKIYYFFEPNYGFYEFDNKRDFVIAVYAFGSEKAEAVDRLKLREHSIGIISQDERWMKNKLDFGKGICLACVAQVAKILFDNYPNPIENISKFHLNELDKVEIGLQETENLIRQGKIKEAQKILQILFKLVNTKKNKEITKKISDLNLEIVDLEQGIKNLNRYGRSRATTRSPGITNEQITKGIEDLEKAIDQVFLTHPQLARLFSYFFKIANQDYQENGVWKNFFYVSNDPKISHYPSEIPISVKLTKLNKQ